MLRSALIYHLYRFSHSKVATKQRLLHLYNQATARCKFQTPERIMFKAHLFIKGCSLRNRCNDEYFLLKRHQCAGL